MLFIGAAGESPRDSWCGPSSTSQQSQEGFLEVSAAQQPQCAQRTGSQGTSSCLSAEESLVHLHPGFGGVGNQAEGVPSPLLKAGPESCRGAALAHGELFPDVLAELC